MKYTTPVARVCRREGVVHYRKISREYNCTVCVCVFSNITVYDAIFVVRVRELFKCHIRYKYVLWCSVQCSDESKECARALRRVRF